ncbi:hypothetical protein IFM46972_11474 [Aspergillus udagawae]|uniref:Uncharacterized protein n=1 Tax=Aspergillus udagawae TaxID=91492 RepID=A0A8H3SHA9_9EURO|nr:hypothetical protein IFM46972_11474 [Aspergillus udagawae]
MKVVDAQDTHLLTTRYTHDFSALAFNLFPNDQAATEGHPSCPEVSRDPYNKHVTAKPMTAKGLLSNFTTPE